MVVLTYIFANDKEQISCMLQCFLCFKVVMCIYSKC